MNFVKTLREEVKTQSQQHNYLDESWGNKEM
jgi:hypothetical protein